MQIGHHAMQVTREACCTLNCRQGRDCPMRRRTPFPAALACVLSVGAAWGGLLWWMVA